MTIALSATHTGPARGACTWGLHVQLFSRSVMCNFLAALWDVAHQAPLSMGFSRQEDWSGLPFPFPGDLPNPGIAGGIFTAEKG